MLFHRVRLVAAFAVLLALPFRALAEGLPPGHHTAHPKHWAEVPAYVTNFTPLQFDYHIDDLTPDRDQGLWFSVGSSMEHIDARDDLTSIPMPFWQWRVSGIALTSDGIVFSAGQSGKLGFVRRAAGPVEYVQAVPRRDFPDLSDLVTNDRGEIWFLDRGRSSIGYRAADGRVVEHPFPDMAYPIRMRHCMGRLWVVAVRTSGSGLYFIDKDLHPVPYLSVVSGRMQVEDIACDSKERLWLSSYDVGRTSTVRFDGLGNRKEYDGLSGAMAPDPEGGMWILGREAGDLIHVAANSARQTIHLPATFYAESVVSEDLAGRLWIGKNDAGSPVAVTRIDPKGPGATAP